MTPSERHGMDEVLQASERLATEPALSPELGVPKLTRLTIYAGAFGLLAFFVWSAIAQVDEVARAQGRIVPIGRTHDVQHPRGGVIAAIYREAGDTVAAGDTLLQLEAYAEAAHRARAASRLWFLEAERERLQKLAASDSGPLVLADVEDTSLAQVTRERHQRSMQAWMRQRRLLLEQATDLRQRADALASARAQSQRQAQLQREEMEMMDDWRERDISTYSEIEQKQLRRTLLSYENQASEAAADERLSTSQVAELRRRLVELDERIVDAALSGLVQVEVEIAEARAQAQRYRREHEQATLVSPVAGVVQGPIRYTAGEVLPAGVSAMRVVPTSQRLVAEVYLRDEDVGHVHPGQPATLKLTTYDFGRFGGLSATVERVYPTDGTGGRSAPAFGAILSFPTPSLGPGLPIVANMVVQADINTQSRSLLEYLVRPIFVSAWSAFHER